ncbi:MAG: type III pantothenate kinase [Verrucomicrobia bacterium]|nr:type III pantothenate kinase [Verrucomicrobiota bacterium]
MHSAAGRADFLLIDIGNTFTKLQLADAAGLHGARRRVPTPELTPSRLIATLGRWRYRRVALCSVVPAATEIIAETLAEPALILKAGARRAAAQFGGVDLRGYSHRHKLGADRLANLAGALGRHGPGPLLVVSLGTAATFDVLDAEARFLGGVIAPGPDALANALHHRTALLPLLAFPTHAYASPAPPALGLSTEGALRAAAFHGWRGMVKEILHAICEEHAARLGFATHGDCTTKIKIVSTGGVAARLAQDVPELQIIDAGLTLDGLRRIALAGGLSLLRRPRVAAGADANRPVSEATISARSGGDDNTLPLAGLGS